jgi:catechol 2,3-dioxygenase-like lactoylglutathione lyase family enzyme
MTVHIHHVNIRTADLEATIAFYVDAIGLTVGDRPPFGFPGAWLYDGAQPAVHLNLVSEAPRNALDPALARLDRLGLRYTRPKPVPGTDIRQCFLRDPNGVTVELQGP